MQIKQPASYQNCESRANHKSSKLVIHQAGKQAIKASIKQNSISRNQQTSKS
jgi:hypothetical protein